MSPTEALLLVIIVVLIYYIATKPRPAKTTSSKTWDCVDRCTGDVTAVQMKYERPDHSSGCKCPKCSSPEQNAQAESVEGFQSCMGPPDTHLGLDCDSCGDTFDYATHEFGAAGMSYKDWASTQAVDPAVVKNHAEFVKDRAGNDQKQIITGRTMAMPDHESYQPTPWIGIRGRPTRVPVCNPTEQTDDAIEFYPEKQKVVWHTS